MKFLQKHCSILTKGLMLQSHCKTVPLICSRETFFVKFNNVVGENLSQRFPSLLSWCFKDLPGTFARGFDSFVCHKAFGRALATKGADRVHSI